MICFENPVLIGLLYSAKKKKKNFQCRAIRAIYIFENPSIFKREQPIFPSERMLHKDYDLMGSVEQ
jgi:hypothetical protein